jgi:hypothetical protein
LISYRGAMGTKPKRNRDAEGEKIGGPSIF